MLPHPAQFIFPLLDLYKKRQAKRVQRQQNHQAVNANNARRARNTG